jgi:hypothetical protein
LLPEDDEPPLPPLPPPLPPLFPPRAGTTAEAVSLTCSTTRLITLRARLATVGDFFALLDFEPPRDAAEPLDRAGAAAARGATFFDELFEPPELLEPPFFAPPAFFALPPDGRAALRAGALRRADDLLPPEALPPLRAAALRLEDEAFFEEPLDAEAFFEELAPFFEDLEAEAFFDDALEAEAFFEELDAPFLEDFDDDLEAEPFDALLPDDFFAAPLLALLFFAPFDALFFAAISFSCSERFGGEPYFLIRETSLHAQPGVRVAQKTM